MAFLRYVLLQKSWACRSPSSFESSRIIIIPSYSIVWEKWLSSHRRSSFRASRNFACPRKLHRMDNHANQRFARWDPMQKRRETAKLQKTRQKSHFFNEIVFQFGYRTLSNRTSLYYWLNQFLGADLELSSCRNSGKTLTNSTF